MLIEVIGRAGMQAKTYGTVHASSFQKAVEMVFANRLLYPRILPDGNGRWRVQVIKPMNHISYIEVVARRAKSSITA